MRQLLTESTILAAIGGGLGVLLAWVGIRLILRLDGGEIPRLADTRIDGIVLLFSLGLTLLAGLLVGVVPALQQSTASVRGTLGEGARSSSGGREGNRLRRTLVAAQVAMALLVLIGAGLLGRSLLALQRVKPGFSPSSVVTLQLTLPRSKYDSAAKIVAFFEQLRAATAAIPGVSEASAVYPVPMGGDGWSGSFNVEGEPTGPEDPLPQAEYAVALPGYFHAMKIPLIVGRDFETTDRADAPAVVIVDETLASQHWPHQSPLNKRIGSPGQWATVVGVVGHVHNAGPQTDGEPQIYIPLLQNAPATVSVVARTSAPITSLAGPIRARVKGLDPDLPIARVRSLDDLVSQAVARQRFNVLLVTIFAVTALVLASIGLYGVMAFLVAQPTRGIGIRVALGGDPRAIRAMVLREGSFICVGGLVAGTVAALVLTRGLSGLLFGVGASDPTTYAGIALLLLVVGALASYGPARRATRVDPVVALRE